MLRRVFAGNFTRVWYDHVVTGPFRVLVAGDWHARQLTIGVSMSSQSRDVCAQVRESLSAWLDGERASLAERVVLDHLGGCDRCAAVASRMEEVHRLSRVSPAVEVPDLTSGILTALASDRSGARDRRRRELRLLVGFAGAAQLLLALPFLVGLLGSGQHVGRDLGALQVALGVGFVVAALQPFRAVGLLPVAAVVAVSVVVLGVVDVATGQAAWLVELTHLSELIGVLALWALSRTEPETPALLAARTSG